MKPIHILFTSGGTVFWPEEELHDRYGSRYQWGGAQLGRVGKEGHDTYIPVYYTVDPLKLASEYWKTVVVGRMKTTGCVSSEGWCSESTVIDMIGQR